MASSFSLKFLSVIFIYKLLYSLVRYLCLDSESLECVEDGDEDQSCSNTFRKWMLPQKEV